MSAIADSQADTVFPGIRWREASPESQGLDSARLRAAVADMDSRFGPDGAKELAIVRNGYLIWQYHDHQVFVLGEILTRLAGEPLAAAFQRRIAGPIGLTRWDWGVSGQVDGIDLNNAAGTPSKAPGIQITARQLARYGHLYLNRGNWDGRQLLPAAFVEQAERNQVPNVGASKFLHGRFGFYWWTNDVMPDGKRPWPAAPPKTYTAHGRGCNYCFVVPEWNMVIVRMGTSPIGPIAEQDVLWNAFFAGLAEAMAQGHSVDVAGGDAGP